MPPAKFLGIVQKVYEWWSCPFAKMIPLWEKYFGKSLVYFLNYVCLFWYLTQSTYLWDTLFHHCEENQSNLEWEIWIWFFLLWKFESMVTFTIKYINFKFFNLIDNNSTVFAVGVNMKGVSECFHVYLWKIGCLRQRCIRKFW